MPAYLKADTTAALPMAGAPKVMQRTSAMGHCTAAHIAAKVATEPPTQKPTTLIRLGRAPPAW